MTRNGLEQPSLLLVSLRKADNTMAIIAATSVWGRHTDPSMAAIEAVLIVLSNPIAALGSSGPVRRPEC